MHIHNFILKTRLQSDQTWRLYTDLHDDGHKLRVTGMVLSTNIPYMANANDKFEDTKGEIRTYKFKKDRQYNGQKKKGS